MNLQQLEGRFFTYAGDPFRERFPPLTVDAALNDTQNEFNQETGLYRLCQQMSIDTGVVDLTQLPQAAWGGEVLRVEDLQRNGARLTRTSPDELDNLIGPEWRTNTEGDLLYFFQGISKSGGPSPAGADTLHTYPLVTRATIGIGVNVYYVATPPNMQNPVDISVLPGTFHQALVWGALMKLIGSRKPLPTDQAILTNAAAQYGRFLKAGQETTARWAAS